MNLKGNKILITGATGGIGLALLNKFIELENRVIAVGRDDNKLIKIKSIYRDIITIKSDLSKPASVSDLISEIEKNHSDINTLINNAGIQINFYDERFGENNSNFDVIEKEIRINLTTPIELCYKLIPMLLKNDNASIINISSALGFIPKKSAPVYCSTKSGIHIFSKSLRYQYEDTNLKIFEVIPTLVDTNMTKGRGKGKITPEQFVEELIKNYHKNHYEINIGKVKLLRIIQRLLPDVADKILKNN